MEMEMEMEIYHPGHQHPLILSEDNNNDGFDCSVCGTIAGSNTCYVCAGCNYYLHKHCAEISAVYPHQISYRFHPQHLLILKLISHLQSCYSCGANIYNALSFCCFKCNLYLHPFCALLREREDIDFHVEEYIHIGHEHPLILWKTTGDNLFECFRCQTNCSDLTYGCFRCKFFIHKSCSEIPKNILHAIHPHHALNLSVDYGGCQYCQVRDTSFKFKCSLCDFFLHVNCGLMSTRESKGKKHEGSCFICKNYHHKDPTYICVDMKYYLSQSCIELPKMVTKRYFHRHNFTLTPGTRSSKSVWCDSCHKSFKNVPFYSCFDCDVDMDIRCALMTSIEYDKDRVLVNDRSHQHSLVVFTETDHGDTDISCWACKRSFLPMYACKPCEYYVHKSCAEIPTYQIDHPLHLKHSLYSEWVDEDRTCDSCYRIFQGLFYQCKWCRFSIGAECVFLKPTIDCKLHPDHSLFIIEMGGSRVGFELKCNANVRCELFSDSNEYKLTESFTSCCVSCNFYLHLLCGPLPCIIKHKCHIHELELVDSMVEDDTDEHYCDVCEEQRDPRICVYYCKQCNFVSHVHCVMSEVIMALKKDPGVVKVRTVSEFLMGEKEKEQSILIQEAEDDELNLYWISTLKELLLSLTDDETEKIQGFFPYEVIYEDHISYQEKNKGLVSDEGSSKILESFPYDDNFIAKLLHSISASNFKGKFYIDKRQTEMKLVKVQGYLTTSNSEPTLAKIFSTYGDLSINSDLNRKLRSLVYYLLCWVVNDMRRVHIDDITKDLLCMWIYYLACVKDAGFNVDFTSKYIKEVIDAYVGLQIMRCKEEIPILLEERNAKLKRELGDVTAELEKVKECKEEFVLRAKEPKPDDLQNYLSKAKELKWTTAEGTLAGGIC